MTSLAYNSALELAEKIKKQEISSRELTQLYIDRIEKYDGDINAVVVRTFEDALARADEADQAAEHRASPVHTFFVGRLDKQAERRVAAVRDLEGFRTLAGDTG